MPNLLAVNAIFGAGLSSEAAAERQRRLGRNELERERRTPLLVTFIRQFSNVVSGSALFIARASSYLFGAYTMRACRR